MNTLRFRLKTNYGTGPWYVIHKHALKTDSIVYISTCNEWPLQHETTHKTFATMKKNNVKSQVAKATKRINVKNIQGQYESTYPVAQMTIVSDRPIQQGMKYRGTITVDDIERGDTTVVIQSKTIESYDASKRL